MRGVEFLMFGLLSLLVFLWTRWCWGNSEWFRSFSYNATQSVAATAWAFGDMVSTRTTAHKSNWNASIESCAINVYSTFYFTFRQSTLTCTLLKICRFVTFSSGVVLNAKFTVVNLIQSTILRLQYVKKFLRFQTIVKVIQLCSIMKKDFIYVCTKKDPIVTIKKTRLC